jgi:hypothetical protein
LNGISRKKEKYFVGKLDGTAAKLSMVLTVLLFILFYAVTVTNSLYRVNRVLKRNLVNQKENQCLSLIDDPFQHQFL